MIDRLNPESAVPLYRQLVTALRESVMAGEFPKNSKIPTEMELSGKYGISRITVRSAIDELVDEGILIRRQGKGTYVAPDRLERDMRKFMGFTEACEEGGKQASSKVLSLEIKPATEKQVKMLQLPEDVKVIYLTRARYLDDLPVIMEINIFSMDYSFLLQEKLEGSLYGLLRGRGINPSHGRRTISVCYASKQEADILDTEELAPLLLVEDMVCDDRNRPLHICKQVIRSDRYQMVFDC